MFTSTVTFISHQQSQGVEEEAVAYTFNEAGSVKMNPYRRYVTIGWPWTRWRHPGYTEKVQINKINTLDIF